MQLPIMAFWLMSGNIRRVRASSDMRGLAMNLAAQSSEGAQDYQERLILELGTVTSAPVVLDTERDEEGFEELKAIAAAM